MLRDNNKKKANENPINNEPHFTLSTEGQFNSQDDFSFRMGFMSGENPVLFLPPQQLYRGDTRAPIETNDILKPDNIFKKGFKAIGYNNDLSSHLFGLDDSAYISTSLSKEIATSYPKGINNIKKTYVYEINPTQPGIPVVEKLCKQGEYSNLFSSFAKEKEIAFLSQIKPSEIKGCWEVEIKKVLKHDPKQYLEAGYSKEWIGDMCYEYERFIQKKFIPNPNYRPQVVPGQSLWLIGKPIGIGLTAFSFGLDAEHLYNEFKQGQETGDYNNAYREAAGVALGWPTALVAGRWGVKLAATLCATLTPWGKILCTAGLEMAASIIGYAAGNKEGKIIYDDTKKNSAACNPKLIADKTITQSSIFSLFGNANAQELPEELDPRPHKPTSAMQKLAANYTKQLDTTIIRPTRNNSAEKRPTTTFPRPQPRSTLFQQNAKKTVEQELNIESIYLQLNENEKQLYDLANGLFIEHFNKDLNEIVAEKNKKTTAKHAKKNNSANNKTRHKKNVPIVQKTPEEEVKQYQQQLCEELPAVLLAQNALIQIAERKAPGELTIRDITNSLYDWGNLLSDAAYLARLAGVHQRSCQGFALAGAGLSKLAIGIDQIMLSAAGGASMGAMLAGPVGVAIGLFSIAISVFQNDAQEDGLGEALNAIMQAMQTMHRSMLEGFRRLETLISQGMIGIVKRLDKIRAQLNRLENIMAASFKEQQEGPLMDAMSEITREMKGNCQLSEEVRNKHLRYLQNWIEIHAYSTIQTSLLKQGEAEKGIEILTEYRHNMGSIFPLFILQLNDVLPHEVFHYNNIGNIPNVELLMQLCGFFIAAIKHYREEKSYQLKDNYIPTLENAIDSLKNVKNLIGSFNINAKEKGLQGIFPVLLMQCMDLQTHIGSAIQKCFSEKAVQNAPDHTPFKLLPISEVSKDNLLFLFNQFEWRRLLLFHLSRFADNPEPWQLLISGLMTKEWCLNLSKKTYLKKANGFDSSLLWGDFDKFNLALLHGADLNLWKHTVGTLAKEQPIHYLIRRHEIWETPSEGGKFLHQLFKAGVEKTNPTITDRGRASNTPGQYIVGGHFFDLALLICAAGVDLQIDFGLQLNVQHNNWKAIITKYLIQDMNDQNGLLNKNDLRDAYAFYCEIETGQGISPHQDINHTCVLWLVAVLGNLNVLQCLGELKVDVNESLPHINFTPLMMAAYCGNEKIVKYLLDLKERANIEACFVTTDPFPVIVNRYDRRNNQLKDSADALFLAKHRKNWQTAQVLINAGLEVSDEEKENIKEKALILAEEEKTSSFKPGPAFSKSHLLERIEEIISLLEAAKTSCTIHNSNPAILTKEEAKKLYDVVKLCIRLIGLLVVTMEENPSLPESTKKYFQKCSQALASLKPLVTKEKLEDPDKSIPLIEKIAKSLFMLDAELKIRLKRSYTLRENVGILLTKLDGWVELVGQQKISNQINVKNDKEIRLVKLKK